ncbi:MAG: hypothetical protein WED32_01705 [Patescibacteria group bacterium]
MIWLGESRGYLSDLITQQWVRITGRRVDIDETHWLAGPVGDASGIGKDFYSVPAAREGLIAVTESDAKPRVWLAARSTLQSTLAAAERAALGPGHQSRSDQ